MSWSDAVDTRQSIEGEHPRSGGGINPFTGPWSPPGPAASPVAHRLDGARVKSGGHPRPIPTPPRRSAARVVPPAPGHPVRPSGPFDAVGGRPDGPDVTGPVGGRLGGTTARDALRWVAHPPAGPGTEQVGWPDGGRAPGRRGPAGLLAANQRVTEPPAGLAVPGYSAPILPPLAEPSRSSSPWRGSSWGRSSWGQGSWQGRRWWLVTAAVLIVVGALGVTGTVLLAPRFAARPDGVLVTARDLTYRVPADWQQRPGGPETSAAGVALDGVATAARYTCGGHGYYRATVGSTFLVRRDGVNARPEDAVRDFGPLFATSFYGAGATTSATAPAPLTVGAQTGSTSLVTVTQPASSGCPDLVGRITVVALPTSRKGASGGTGVLLLVVQHDAAGGPATSAPVDDHTVAEILSSVRVTP